MLWGGLVRADREGRMSFAYDTRIAVPSSGEVPIQSLAVGDSVQAASLRPGEAPFWEPSEVELSEGIAPGLAETAVAIAFSDGGPPLVCVPDQIFVGADGRLVAADLLAPGDALLRPDGGQRPIVSVVLGRFIGGLHDVATSRDWNGSPDGHLLAADGVIAGDYLVQLHLGPSRPGSRGRADAAPQDQPAIRRARKE